MGGRGGGGPPTASACSRQSSLCSICSTADKDKKNRWNQQRWGLGRGMLGGMEGGGGGGATRIAMPMESGGRGEGSIKDKGTQKGEP